jgi:hypothetical protein
MFAGYFGKEWAHRMAGQVLFPSGEAATELELASGVLDSGDVRPA